jgi:hypothetical protein
MAFPTFALEVAFATDPFAVTPTWADVTAYLQRADTSRGRQFELDQVEAGTLKAVLDNADRRFEPQYASSPYYPNVEPVRKIRLSATIGGTPYYLFTGFVERWPVDWSQNASTVEVTATDGFEALNSFQLVASYPQELAGARINRVLDDVGWPAADRAIDAGQSLLAAVTFAEEDEQGALGHIQDATLSDGPTASFFIDGRGYAVFHDRHKRLKAP